MLPLLMYLKMINRLKRLKYGRNIRANLHDYKLDYIFIDYLIIIFKCIIYPIEYLKRKLIYFKIFFDKESYRFIRNEDGYSIENKISNKSKKLVNVCEQIFDEFKYSDKYKFGNDYIYNLLDKNTIQRNKYLIDFAMDDYLVKTATMYLGILPTIGSIKLWWTPKNKLNKGSQLFHIDQVDRKQLKLLINIKPTDIEHGPFTFIPKKHSQKFIKLSHKPFQSKSDTEILQKINRNNLIQHTGKPGSMVFVDSSNCYHFGGRTKKRDRLILMIQYLPFHCVKETSDTDWLITSTYMRKYFEKKIKYDYLLKLPPSPFIKLEKN